MSIEVTGVLIVLIIGSCATVSSYLCLHERRSSHARDLHEVAVRYRLLTHEIVELNSRIKSLERLLDEAQ